MQAAGTWKRSPKGFGPPDAQSKKCCFGGAGSSPWPCHRGQASDVPPSQTRKWGYLEFYQQGWWWYRPVHLRLQWGHPAEVLWPPRKVRKKKKSDWLKHLNLRRQWHPNWLVCYSHQSTQSYFPHKVSLSLKNQDIFHMEVMRSQNLAPPKYTSSYKSFCSQQESPK